MGIKREHFGDEYADDKIATLTERAETFLQAVKDWEGKSDKFSRTNNEFYFLILEQIETWK